MAAMPPSQYTPGKPIAANAGPSPTIQLPDGSFTTMQKLAEGSVTKNYSTTQDIAHMVSWMLQRNPILNLNKIEQMLLDPGIRIGLRMRKTPLRKATIAIKCKNPVWRLWVAKQMQCLWREGLKKILRGMEYGFSANELLYHIKPDSAGNNTLSIRALKEFHPRDVRPLTQGGKLCGFRVRSMSGNNTEHVTEPTQEVFIPKGLWYTFDQHFGDLFGRSILLGAQSPFEEMNAKNGGKDSRAHFYYKHAFRGPSIRYPMHDFAVPDGQGGMRYINARDVAVEMAVLGHNGSALIIPNIINKDSGKPEFEVEYPMGGTASGIDIREYIHDLTAEEWLGLGVPDEVIKSGDGGALASRRIPERAFYTAAEDDLYETISQIDEQVLRPVGLLNYGPDFDFQIVILKVEPEEQQPDAPNGGAGAAGGGGGNPFGGGSPFPPDEDDNAGDEPSSPVADPNEKQSVKLSRLSENDRLRHAKVVRQISRELDDDMIALVEGETLTTRKTRRSSASVALSMSGNIGHAEGKAAFGVDIAGTDLIDPIAKIAAKQGMSLSLIVRNRIAFAIAKNPKMTPQRFMAVVEHILTMYQPKLAGILKDTLIASWVVGADRMAKRIPKQDETTGENFFFDGDAIVSTVPITPSSPSLAPVVGQPYPGAGPIGEIPADAEAVPIGGEIAGESEPHSVLAFYGLDESPMVSFPTLDTAFATLQQKIALSSGEYYKLGAQARQAAFTVSHVQAMDTLAHIHQSLADTLAEGGTLTTFKDKIGDAMDSSPLGEGHIENVFRTNIQSAFHAGQERVIRDPKVVSAFPYVKYNAISDTRVRHNHHLMMFSGIPINGKGSSYYRSDDPIWNIWTPPNGYQCRCGLTYLTLRQAARQGIPEAKEWYESGEPPMTPFYTQTEVKPDPGFEHRPSIAPGGSVALSMRGGFAVMTYRDSSIAGRVYLSGSTIPASMFSQIGDRRIARLWQSVSLSIMRAPKGGISVNGRQYSGGQFIPAGAQGAAKSAAKKQIASAHELSGNEVAGMPKKKLVNDVLVGQLGYSEEDAAKIAGNIATAEGDELHDTWDQAVANAPVKAIADADVAEDDPKSKVKKGSDKADVLSGLAKMYSHGTTAIAAGDHDAVAQELVSAGYSQTWAEAGAETLIGFNNDGDIGSEKASKLFAQWLANQKGATENGISFEDIVSKAESSETSSKDGGGEPEWNTEPVENLTEEHLSRWWAQSGDDFYDELTGRLQAVGMKKFASAKIALQVSESLEAGKPEEAFAKFGDALTAAGVVLTPQLKGVTPDALHDWWNRDPDKFLDNLTKELKEQGGLGKLASAKMAMSIADHLEQGDAGAAYNALGDALKPHGIKLPKVAEKPPEKPAEDAIEEISGGVGDAAVVEPESAGLPADSPLHQLPAQAVAESLATDAAVAAGAAPSAVAQEPDPTPKQKAKDRVAMDNLLATASQYATDGNETALKQFMKDYIGLSDNNATSWAQHAIAMAAHPAEDGHDGHQVIKKLLDGTPKAKYIGWPKEKPADESQAVAEEPASKPKDAAAMNDLVQTGKALAHSGDTAGLRQFLQDHAGMSYANAEAWAEQIAYDIGGAGAMIAKKLAETDAAKAIGWSGEKTPKTSSDLTSEYNAAMKMANNGNVAGLEKWLLDEGHVNDADDAKVVATHLTKFPHKAEKELTTLIKHSDAGEFAGWTGAQPSSNQTPQAKAADESPEITPTTSATAQASAVGKAQRSVLDWSHGAAIGGTDGVKAYKASKAVNDQLHAAGVPWPLESIVGDFWNATGKEAEATHALKQMSAWLASPDGAIASDVASQFDSLIDSIANWDEVNGEQWSKIKKSLDEVTKQTGQEFPDIFAAGNATLDMMEAGDKQQALLGVGDLKKAITGHLFAGLKDSVPAWAKMDSEPPEKTVHGAPPDMHAAPEKLQAAEPVTTIAKAKFTKAYTENPHAALAEAKRDLSVENVLEHLSDSAVFGAGPAASQISTALSAGLGYPPETSKAMANIIEMKAKGMTPDGPEDLAELNTLLTNITEASPNAKIVKESLNSKDYESSHVEIESTTLGGSTGAKLVNIHGQKFVMKKGGGNNAQEHAANEVATNVLLRTLGVSAPKSHTATYEGKKHAFNEFLEGGEPVTIAELKKDKGVQSSFAAHALLGNWDAIGQSVDNVLKGPDGTIRFIDNGGSMRFRAQGKHKFASDWGGSDGGHVVSEIDSMRKTGTAGEVWGGLSDMEIAKQIITLSDSLPSKSAITGMLMQTGVPKLGQIGEADKEADTITKRMAYMKKWANAVISGTPKPPTEKSEYDDWHEEYGSQAEAAINHAEKAKFKVHPSKSKPGAWQVSQNINGLWTSIGDGIESAKSAVIAAKNAKAAMLGGSVPSPSKATGKMTNSVKPGDHVDPSQYQFKVVETDVGGEKHHSVQTQKSDGEWMTVKSYSGKTSLASAKAFITKKKSAAAKKMHAMGAKLHDFKVPNTYTPIAGKPGLYKEHYHHNDPTPVELGAAKSMLSSESATSTSKLPSNANCSTLERQAMYHFWNGGYYSFNTYLRARAAGTTTPDPAQDGYAKILAAGLSKVMAAKGGGYKTKEIPAGADPAIGNPKEWSESQWLWRGTTLSDSVIANYEAHMKDSKPFVDPAFASTAKKQKAAFSGNTCFKIIAKGKYAPDVSMVSQHSGEKECTMIAGARYKVHAVHKDHQWPDDEKYNAASKGWKHLIVLEEV